MRVLIVGAGAQAKYALETFSLTGEHEVIGLLDLSPAGSMVGQRLYGVPVLGGLDLLDEPGELEYEGALVACTSNRQKEQLAERLLARGAVLTRAIHPSAVTAGSASIGEGAIVNALTVIQPYARVGRGAMIHAGVIVEHDCIVEEYANLAPGVTLAGHVRVCRGAYLYTGAKVVPGVTIGEHAMVGAGAVVLQDVAPGTTVVGVPAAVHSGASMELTA